MESKGNPARDILAKMNPYFLHTRDGAIYYVEASMVEDAIRKVATVTKSFVSCWFIGGKFTANVIRL